MIVTTALLKCFANSQNFYLEIKANLRTRVPGRKIFYHKSYVKHENHS